MSDRSRPATAPSQWIHSARFDLSFIIGPGLAAAVVALYLHYQFPELKDLSPFLWLALVVFVDVAHVYSTVLRTYLLPSEWQKHSLSFRLVPLLGFAAAVLLHTINPLWFWRVLAYLAVFHFVRQQYGFFRIYERKSFSPPRWKERVDQISIYLSTLIPLWIWHVRGLQSFHWFRTDDFYYVAAPGWDAAGYWFAGVWWTFYICTEIWLTLRNRSFLWAKNLFLFSSLAAWWIGIVFIQTDMGFSITNILAHGIPYFALIYVYQNRLARSPKEHRTSLGFSQKHLASPWIYVLCLLPLTFIAFLEEGLWDRWIWQDHALFFGSWPLSPVLASTANWLVPVLVLPQIIHYLLDGFIWRTQSFTMKATDS